MKKLLPLILLTSCTTVRYVDRGIPNQFERNVMMKEVTSCPSGYIMAKDYYGEFLCVLPKTGRDQWALEQNKPKEAKIAPKIESYDSLDINDIYPELYDHGEEKEEEEEYLSEGEV